jgi:hypothetical protein
MLLKYPTWFVLLFKKWMGTTTKRPQACGTIEQAEVREHAIKSDNGGTVVVFAVQDSAKLAK